MSTKTVIVDVDRLYAGDGTAKVSMLEHYKAEARRLAGEGNVVILTGAGPVWLYLTVMHALHGIARKLIYRSPVTGDVVIFDHSPD